MRSLPDIAIRRHMNGYPESSDSHRIAKELLRRRMEVRRMRHALGMVVAMQSVDRIVRGWCSNALKPNRGAK